MKRKMLGAASVVMTAAALAMPASAPAQVEELIDNSCTSNGVIECAIALVRFGADTGAWAYNKVCVVVFGPHRC